MFSPAVIGGFAAIDAAVLGQLVYGIRSYERHHGDERHHGADSRERHSDRTARPAPSRRHRAPKSVH